MSSPPKKKLNGFKIRREEHSLHIETKKGRIVATFSKSAIFTPNSHDKKIYQKGAWEIFVQDIYDSTKILLNLYDKPLFFRNDII